MLRPKTAKSHIKTITNAQQVENCLDETPVKVTGLSILQVPSQKRQLPGLKLPARSKLAPFVVFAAPITPKQEPDVAVGLAVAEHLAKTGGGPVSLVVIPRYLEADPELENMLRTQPALVKGGIVLGQTPTVPDDTQALLRQVLTTVNRQSLANQIQATLGSAGPLIAALLTLLGLAAAALAAPTIIAFGISTIREVLSRIERSTVTPGSDTPGSDTPGSDTPGSDTPGSDTPGSDTLSLRERVQRLWRHIVERLRLRPAQCSPKGTEWLEELTEKELMEELTISLRSSRTVTGKFPQQNKYKTRNVKVWRIREATVRQDGFSVESADNVLVSVADIELIRFNDPDPTRPRTP